jgi:hypothetical protein
MDMYDITGRVGAMHHTQKAITVLDSLKMRGPELDTLVENLKEVRKELAYEVYRAKQD